MRYWIREESAYDLGSEFVAAHAAYRMWDSSRGAQWKGVYFRLAFIIHKEMLRTSFHRGRTEVAFAILILMLIFSTQLI